MTAICKLFSKPLVILLSVLLCLLLILGGIYFADPYQLRMAPGVTVGGVDVSQMLPWEAYRSVNTCLEDSLYGQSLQIRLPKETLTLSPADTHPEVRLKNAIWKAFQFGRSEAQTDAIISLSEYLSTDDAYIRAQLQSYAKKYDTTFAEANWSLHGDAPDLSTASFDPDAACQVLTVTLGIPESHLDVEHAAAQTLSAMANAIAACASETYFVDVDIVPTSVPSLPDPEVLYREFCREPISDSLDLETYQFVHGQYGYRFDKETLVEQLSAAAPGETVSVTMEYVQPEILGEAVYFRDVLGSCETKHNSNENRNTNLRLLCAALDGHVMQPGEEFSFNNVVGERTAEKGYKPAPAYSTSGLVDSIGGGVCQGSTTIYNCVLLADLEVVFRACHGATVGYVPLGLDASVNFLTTDFKFRNSSHFPIMIRAEVSDGYVKMKILGTDEKDYYIKMEALSGEDEIAIYSRSYKCKYDKETDELISREIEAFSTYYKSIG